MSSFDLKFVNHSMACKSVKWSQKTWMSRDDLFAFPSHGSQTTCFIKMSEVAPQSLEVAPFLHNPTPQLSHVLLRPELPLEAGRAEGPCWAGLVLYPNGAADQGCPRMGFAELLE